MCTIPRVSYSYKGSEGQLNLQETSAVRLVDGNGFHFPDILSPVASAKCNISYRIKGDSDTFTKRKKVKLDTQRITVESSAGPRLLIAKIL